MQVERVQRLIRVLQHWQLRFHRIISRIGLPDYTLFTIFSIIIGAVAGLAAVFFHETIGLFTDLFFNHGLSYLAFLGPAAVVIIPMLGMLVQSFMILIAPDVAKNRGVLAVIKAVAIRGGYIPFRTTLFHFLAPAICIGSGGTVGPEGPAAQLGGGVASKVSRFFGLPDSRRRMFTAAGSGAAIAAVFNTPLGGVFFALEIILLNDFQTPTFSALILASVTASAISRIFLGNQPAFHFSDIAIGPYNQLYLYALLGIGAGAVSLLYIKYSEKLNKFLHQYVLRKIPQWLLMSGIGLLLGVAGYYYRDIFGIGYEAINRILADGIPWQTVAVLFVLKLIFVPLILESGGFGGVFAPSLFLGACYGFLFSFALNHFFSLGLDTTAYTLVGMGAMLGGINSIPISAILILFEMSREYAFILPLMLGVVTSTTIVQLIIKDSIHSKHLKQEGYRISHGREIHVLRSLKVKDVMRKDVVLIDEDTPLSQLLKVLIESPHNTFYTKDKNGRLRGTISITELRPLFSEYDYLREMVIARDIANDHVITVREDDDLDYVLNLFGYENVDEFPVISANEPGKVVGTVWRQDVLAAYNQASIKYDITDGLARSLRTLEKTHEVKVAEGYAIVERPAPERFVGKSIKELRLRNRYGLEVLMIRPATPPFASEEPETIIATPDYVIQEGDTLVLFGPEDKIAKTEKWCRE